MTITSHTHAHTLHSTIFRPVFQVEGGSTHKEVTAAAADSELTFTTSRGAEDNRGRPGNSPNTDAQMKEQ